MSSSCKGSDGTVFGGRGGTGIMYVTIPVPPLPPKTVSLEEEGAQEL